MRRAALAGCVALACASGGAPAPDTATEPKQAPAPAPAPLPVPPRFAETVAYSGERGGLVLLVVEGGEVVLETGQPGSDPRAPHPIHGGSDAFWGTLALAAAEDGLLTLDEPVAATLPEFATDRKKAEITLQQLLHFTSGLESAAIRSGATSDTLELELVSSPGERFQYGPSHLRVFTEVLGRKLEDAGQDPDPVRYLETRVLHPIDARIAAWERDASGRVDPGDGASISARDWARFGALLLGRGRVGDVQIVDPERMQALFEGSSANPTFGLTLWLNAESKRMIGERWGGRAPAPAFYPDGLEDLVVATGAGNQRLYVIPSLDLVVVRFGERDTHFRDADLLARLVAAVKSPS